MLQEQIMEEIKQIPNNKNHKLSVKKCPIGLLKGKFEVPASFFEPLSDEFIDSFKSK
jgi:hypothetical protein